LRELAVEYGVQVQSKGLLEDAGPTLTHKDWIVDLDQHGFTAEEISFLSRHAPSSRDRYIETYRRVETLRALKGRVPDEAEVVKELRLRPHIARQYLDLLQKYDGENPVTQISLAS